jgi:hypothetical protein
MKSFIKSKKTVLVFVIGLALTCTFSTPSISLAVDTPSSYTVLAPLPCIPSSTVTCPGGNGSLQDKVTFQQYVQYSINLLIALAAVAAVFMIVWGGFEYMTSASFSTKSDGLAKVRNAVYGLVLVLASYLIIKTIDPRFVNIPTTLVPQLKLKCPNLGQEKLDITDPNCKSSTVASLIDQAQQFNQNGQAAIDSARATQAAIADLQSQLSAAQQEYDHECASVGLEDPTCAQTYAQIANLRNQIQSKQASVIVDTAKSVMDNGDVAQTLQNMNNLQIQGNLNPDAVDKQVSAGIASLNQTAVTRESDLNKIGAYNQNAVIEEKKNEDTVSLSLAGVSAKADAMWTTWYGLHGTGTLGIVSLANYKASLISQLDAISANQMSLVTDPAAKAQLQNTLATVKTKVNNLK